MISLYLLTQMPFLSTDISLETKLKRINMILENRTSINCGSPDKPVFLCTLFLGTTLFQP